MRTRASWFFLFFAASGFASLVYQVVWLRLAMAQFGVTSALTAIVLSVFMAGLALGSWGSGRLARRFGWDRDPRAALRAYGIVELLIGVSPFVVPAVLSGGHAMLAAQASTVSWGSASYYTASFFWVAVALLPFSTLMGATFPTAMAALRESRTFSYLYLANVLGALAGTLASAFVMIELLGFRGAARATALLNVAVGVGALLLSSRQTGPTTADTPEARRKEKGKAKAKDKEGLREPVLATRAMLFFLAATGLMSLAMELVWIRQFTPYLGTFVYAFALILAFYLFGTFLGSRIYRTWSVRRRGGGTARTLGAAWASVGICALLPLVAADPRLPLSGGVAASLLRVGFGVLPFCATVGFLTPMLVDRWSQGDPRRAGDAYAVNVLGCILGPLLAGFVLLPHVSESWALFLLGVPPAAAGALLSGSPRARGLAAAVAAAGLLAIGLTRAYDSRYPSRVVRRDATATVVATGEGPYRQLLVNGYGMTILTPNTKLMAHLPLAFHPAPRDALVLCFGMGTTFRSMLQWGVSTTVVELVPSVPRVASYYHADALELQRRPGAQVVIDDARRYLERSAQQYDVITLDPPPPVEAAASSLLYSREFYSLVKRRLRPGGILQQWLPPTEPAIVVSFARTIAEAFPHVRVFAGLEGSNALHFIASEAPLATLPPDALADRLPLAAATDLVEWGPETTAHAQFARLFSQEISLGRLLQLVPDVPVLEDDRPFNEYFLLRRARRSGHPRGRAGAAAGAEQRALPLQPGGERLRVAPAPAVRHVPHAQVLDDAGTAVHDVVVGVDVEEEVRPAPPPAGVRRGEAGELVGAEDVAGREVLGGEEGRGEPQGVGPAPLDHVLGEEVVPAARVERDPAEVGVIEHDAVPADGRAVDADRGIGGPQGDPVRVAAEREDGVPLDRVDVVGLGGDPVERLLAEVEPVVGDLHHGGAFGPDLQADVHPLHAVGPDRAGGVEVADAQALPEVGAEADVLGDLPGALLGLEAAAGEVDEVLLEDDGPGRAVGGRRLAEPEAAKRRLHVHELVVAERDRGVEAALRHQSAHFGEGAELGEVDRLQGGLGEADPLDRHAAQAEDEGVGAARRVGAQVPDGNRPAADRGPGAAHRLATEVKVVAHGEVERYSVHEELDDVAQRPQRDVPRAVVVPVDGTDGEVAEVEGSRLPGQVYRLEEDGASLLDGGPDGGDVFRRVPGGVDDRVGAHGGSRPGQAQEAEEDRGGSHGSFLYGLRRTGAAKRKAAPDPRRPFRAPRASWGRKAPPLGRRGVERRLVLFHATGWSGLPKQDGRRAHREGHRPGSGGAPPGISSARRTPG
jgi:spermidine synthase